MSRILGIDYGSKKSGVALSDESQSLAFPKDIFLTDKNLILKLEEIIKKEKVSSIVLGLSLDKSGIKNPIMEEIEGFKKDLEKRFKLPVYLEPEIWTTAEVIREEGKPGMARKVKKVIKKKIDAQAAALILQRYLARKKNGSL